MEVCGAVVKPGFGVLILNLQLCILKANEGFERHSERVIKIAEALMDRQEVPAVKAQVPLLLQILEEEFWQNITVPVLEVLRIRIRSLVKHIDKTGQEIVYTDFQDVLGSSEIITVTDAAERSLVKFRAKAKAFLNENLNHISLNKLRMNQPLTASDLSELERFLVDAGIADQTVIERAAEQSDGLGIFVRSLIGLDKAAAQDAFAAFTDGKMFNADQLQFVKMIIDYLTERGAVPASALYESPFTNSTPQGPDSIFNSDQVDNIIEILASVDNNAGLKAASG